MTPMLVTDCGMEVRMPLGRWLDEPDPGERRLLAEVRGPVLDVGCGPGRHVVALSEAGTSALGIDVSPEAIGIARSRGATVLLRSVFDPLPGTARWMSVLLLDGNIGIGGDPVTLLRRLRELLASKGRIYVEAEPPDRPSRQVTARIVNGTAVSDPFPWAHVSIGDLPSVAARAQLAVSTSWLDSGRHFAVLQAR